MAKISLHNYLDKVDQLLEENQFGDAAQHCLHILMQFPRHLDSYRALAKALLGQRKHHEAIEIFQRVLSAEPNDLLAHIALSDLYRTEMQADLSNWHLQRALEIEPFNEAIQAEYREVFSLDEDEDIASTRVPLNHAALGHLYLRGELFDQATAVLQKTLTENPERIDQELLLAEALWRNGDFHEAEDVCQHVLEKLPNCLTANAILSHILLEGNRVSEAQPFLRRVQSLVQTDQEHANYDSPVGRALTATGSPTLPDQISLKVWDETAVSATREEPTADWVSEIPFGETADSGEPVAEPDLASDPGDMFGWLKGVTAELQGEPPLEAPGSKKQEEPKGETDWFVDKALEDKSASPDDHSVTDWLEGERAGLFENGQIGDEAPAVAGSSDEDLPSPLPDWLAKETVQPIIDEVPEAAVEQEDMPEWLNEVADSDFEPMQLNPETASQWLVESEDALVEGVADEEPVDEAADWLAELSGEIDELTSAPLDPEVVGLESDESESETAVPDKTTSDTTDWLNDLTFEDQLVSEEDWLATLSQDNAVAEDMLSSDSEILSDIPDISAADSPSDWLVDADSGTDALDEDWLGALDAAPEETIAETGGLDAKTDGDDWLNDLASGDEWLGDTSESTLPTVEEDEEQFNSEDLLAALAGDNASVQSDAESAGAPFDEDPLADDWLAALAGEEFEKAADYQDQTFTDESDDDDWLAELEKGTQILSTDPAASSVDESESQISVDGGDEYDESSLTDWLSGDEVSHFADEVEDGIEEKEEAEASLTDWLSGDDIEELSDHALSEQEPSEEVEASLTDWLSGDDIEELSDHALPEQEPSEEVEASLTDWLSGDDVEELSDYTLPEQEPSEEVEASLTDWLSGGDVEELSDYTLPEQEPSAEVEASLTDWLSEDDVEPYHDEIAEEPAEMSVTDWLSAEMVDEIDNLEAAEMSSPNDENEQEQEKKDLPEFDQDKPSPDDSLTDDDLVDWLEDLAASADEEEETSAKKENGDKSTSTDDIMEPDQAELPDWLSGAAVFEEEETAVTSDTDVPDWLQDNDDLPDELALSEFNIDSVFDGTGELAGPPTALLDELQPSSAQAPEEAAADETSAPGEDVSWLSELSDDGLDDTSWLGDDPESDSLLDWMNDLDDESKGGAELEVVEPEAPEIEAETAVSEEDEDDFLPPDAIPSDLDDAMSWLEDLAAEESAPVEPLPTIADVLDEGLTDLFEREDEQPVSEIDETVEIEPEVDLGFLEEELFGLIEEDQDVSEEIEEVVETEPETDLGFLEEELFGLIEEDQDASEIEEAAEIEPEADLDFLEEDLFDFAEGGLDVESESTPAFDLDPEMTMSDQDLWALEDTSEVEPEQSPQPEPQESIEIEPEPTETVVQGDGYTEELADLDEAMAWLDNMSNTDELLDDSSLDEVDTNLEPVEESDTFADVLEGAGLPTGDASSVLDKAVADVPEDLDDAMAWLETLAARQGAPLEELPSLQAKETEPEAVFDEVGLEDAAEIDEKGSSEFDKELGGEATEDELLETIPDVPEDLDDAMNWLEELAAKQGAPLEELPSLSQSMDSSLEPLPVAKMPDESVVDLDPDLMAALDWLDETVVDDEADVVVTAVSTQTTDTDLLALLDQLEQIALEPDVPAAEPEVSEPEELPIAEPTLEVSEPEELPVAEPTLTEEPVVEAVEETLGTSNIFDMPDDPDEALAWLEEMSAGDEVVTETAVPDTVVIEPEEEIVAAIPEKLEEPEGDVDDLSAFDIFDMPDDPDEALAWLEEVGDDTPPVAEPATTMVIDPEEIEELASEPVAEPEHELDQDELFAPAEELGEGLDDLFGAFDMPDDPDAALAWLEEVGDDTPPVAEPAAAIVKDSEEIEELTTEPVAEPEPELVQDDLSTPVEELGEGLDDLFGAFDMPDDPEAALDWLEETSDDDLPAPVAEPMTPVFEEPETELEATVDAPDVQEAAADEVDLDADYLSDVPEDPDEAMIWLEKLAARQGASLDELPTVSEHPDEIETPDWISEAAAQAETAVPEVEAPGHEAETAVPEFEVFPEDEDVEEMLPSWLGADTDDDAVIPTQTDWLTDLPEPDVTGWLAAEAEVSGTASEGTGPLPETGPLFESVVSDTGPLEPEPEIELEEDLLDLSDTGELSSSMYQIDEEQLDSARSSLTAGETIAALSTYRELVSRGDGLMMLINELEMVATDYPQQRELRRLLGDAYMRNGQLQKALTTYREALDQL